MPSYRGYIPASRALVRYRPPSGMTRLAPALARGAGRFVPYLGAAMTAYEVGKTAYNAYQSSKSAPKKRGRPKGSKNKPKTVKTVAKYNTTGTYQGGFKGKNKKDSINVKFSARKGAILKIENGGTFSSNGLNSIYPFHGTAVQQVLLSVFMSIVKELMRQARVEIQSFNDVVQGNTTAGDYRFTFFWINNPGQNPVSSTPSTTSYQIPANGIDTYYDASRNLLTHWQSNNGAGDQPKELVEIRMFDNQVTTDVRILGSIKMNQVNFHLISKSKLTLQNRTLAENTIGDGDRDESVDIENNPLTGYLYTNRGKWANFMEPQRGINSSNNFVKSTVLDKDTGLIQLNSETNSQNALQKPPPAYVLGFKRLKKVYLNPGSVYHNKNSFSCYVSFNKLVTILSWQFGNIGSTTATAKALFGTISGFGLEKALDSQRNVAGASNVSIAFQVDQTYMAQLHYKKHIKSTPYTVVNSGQIQYSSDDTTPV